MNTQMDQSTSIDFGDLSDYQFAREFGPSSEQLQVDIMPLIKDGLKYTINAKRKARGLGELTVEPRKILPDKLTPEEETKRRNRRERNRIAAAKCRYKKREKSDLLEDETKRLEDANQELRREIVKLEVEKKLLSDHLQSHLLICHLLHTDTAADPPAISPPMPALQPAPSFDDQTMSANVFSPILAPHSTPGEPLSLWG